MRHLKYARESLITLKKWSNEDIENRLIAYADEFGRGNVLWPIRVALSGRRSSAGPFEIAAIIGKDESIRRIEKAIKIFE